MLLAAAAAGWPTAQERFEYGLGLLITGLRARQQERPEQERREQGRATGPRAAAPG